MIKALLVAADGLSAAIDGVTDQFDDEVAALDLAATEARSAMRASGGLAP